MLVSNSHLQWVLLSAWYCSQLLLLDLLGAGLVEHAGTNIYIFYIRYEHFYSTSNGYKYFGMDDKDQS